MNRFMAITYPIVVIFFIVSLLNFQKYNIEQRTNFHQSVLDTQINYAVDAAVTEMINKTEDLGMDHADIYRAKVNPEVALDTFVNMMLRAYGMAQSKENAAELRSNYIKAFLVAGYDGFYLGTPTKFNSSGGMDIVFESKIPYLYSDPVTNKRYGLNLAFKDAVEFDGGTLRRVTSPISEKDQRVIVSERVTDALTETLYEQKEHQLLESVYLPTEMTTIKSTNPIERITVFCYFEDIFRGYDLPLGSFGIGGSRVQLQRHVGCYKKDYGDGMKNYYAYLDSLPAGVVLVESYETPERAAEEGYYFDVRTLKR